MRILGQSTYVAAEHFKQHTNMCRNIDFAEYRLFFKRFLMCACIYVCMLNIHISKGKQIHQSGIIVHIGSEIRDATERFDRYSHLDNMKIIAHFGTSKQTFFACYYM